MRRYLFRRISQMVPTIFGVILITFVLFNLVGGSPALMTLGEKAAPRQLEEFDEVRGFNRPLLWGWRGPTRALPPSDFSQGAGVWGEIGSVRGEAAPGGLPALVIAGPTEIAIPISFPLLPNASYEWTIRYRLPGAQAAGWAGHELAASEAWTTQSFVVRVETEAQRRPVLIVGDGELELAEITLHRRVDHPWQSQFAAYLGRLVRLDFGRSSSANRPVIELLASGIGPTLSLALPILTGEVVVSLLLALICARYRNRWPDRFLLIASVGMMSVNYLVWIVAGQYLFAYRLGWFPVWGYASLPYLLLPVGIGILHGLGSNVRFYRAVMLDELYRDYVCSARAKGCGESRVLFHHVLRNAWIPVITNLMLSIPFLYTGSLLLESFFGIPGLGYLSVNAIHSADVDVVRAVVLIGSFLYLLSNLTADLLYAWVDPRVRLS
ncbi:MAG: ABC transporter permease [Verrucomicrobia bacterium]|nr:ABC transporter permease [Kiritimatiellia bacterium]MCP5487260.1 ABC transporter permease [Verrucomicrobiota bacterium]